MSAPRVGLAVAAALALVASAASAQNTRWDWCNGKNGASPDLIINGCTAVIQSGKEGPKNLATAFYNRANAFRVKLEYDRAIADYTQAIKLDPKEYDFHVDRGWAYHLKGDFDRAIESHNEAIRIDRGNERAFIMRGAAWQRKGDYDRAIKDNDQAIKINPNNASAYNIRGNDYREMLDYERALNDYNIALDIDPDDEVVFANRCFAQALARRYEAALKDCNESVRLNPSGNWYALGRRGLVYLMMGESEKAVADFDAALKINPGNSNALYGRGLAKVRLGDADGDTDMARAKGLQANIAEYFARHGLN